MAIHLQSNFSLVDWGIVVAYLVGTLAVALYVRPLISDMADYVVAGRSLKTSLAAATLIGSELGLVTVMYSAQKGFTGGFAAFHIPLMAGVVTLLVGLTGFIVAPLREMGVMTIPEYYERRFGRGVRILGGAILAVAGILNMGLFLKAGSLFVTSLTGLTSAVELKLVMTLLLGLVLLYVILGGMMAVVVTDYVQFVVLSIGLLVACVLALREVGWSTLVAAVEDVHGEAGFNPLDSAGFGPSYVVWMVFTAGLVSCAVWQTAVARACSATSADVVKRTYALSSIGFLIRFLIPNFLGICALAFVWRDPSLRGVFLPPGGASSDVTLSAMPLFLGQVLPVGVIGLVGAGMLAAFMSTHDSYLLCWSSVLTQDVVAPLRRSPMSTSDRIRLTRVFIAVIGVFLLVWSLWYPLGQDLWDYIAVTGAVYFTGAFALLLFGLYWSRASRTGAYLALVSGFLAVLGLAPVQDLVHLDVLERRLGLVWTGEVAGLATVGVSLSLMVIGSVLFPDREAAS
jgi:SSS family solute:Na+ symporter